MATILLIIIFITYIGLGIPDSLLGAAWPAIYPEFNLPVSYASYVTICISVGTVISSYFAARIINRFGTARVVAISTSVTAIALLGFSFAQNMLWLCALAFPLGLGAGSIDTALNNYVALHYKASHINFLHCFYGIGVSVSPYLMSVALSDSGNWRGGYRIMFYFQLAIAILTVVSLPVWKKVGEKTGKEDEKSKVLSTKEIFSIRGVKAATGVFVFSCAIESLCLVWGSTFLVESKNLTADEAAEIITLYFVGLALGRFVSGVAANRLSSVKIILIGQGVTLVAIVLTALPLSAGIAAAGLFLVGFGNGPVFPNMTHIIPQTFGQEVSQSVIGLQMALSYVSIMTAPLIFGQVAQRFGADLMPWGLLIFYVIMMASTFTLLPVLKKRKCE